MEQIWHQRANNPKAITERYKKIPKLSGVILKLEWQPQLYRFELDLRLKQFPDVTSPKWSKEANVVAMSLSFFAVQRVATQGLVAANDAVVDMDIAAKEPFLVLKTSDGSLEVEFETFTINGFSAYTLEADDTP
jgi:hypothetical protein